MRPMLNTVSILIVAVVTVVLYIAVVHPIAMRRVNATHENIGKGR